MSSVSGIRLPGLATGMDTENMVKEMLKGEQNKIDKVKQKEQTIKWQQEIYRDVVKDIKGFNDKYFSLSSKDSILNSSSWNTLSVSSSNSNVITATGTAGANKVDYKFKVDKLAESAKASSSVAIKDGSVKLTDTVKNGGLGAKSGDKFKIEIGKDDSGNPIYSDIVTIEDTDTINSLVNKINGASNGNIKASFSEMTGQFTIETKGTGESSILNIVEESGSITSSLDFLGLKAKTGEKNADGTPKMEDFNGKTKGSNSIINVSSKDGSFNKILNEESNSFTIDGIKYNLNSTGEADISSKQDVQPVVDNMKAFVEDYNKMIDKMYDLITQKTNRDYPPLTEAQKEDMSEEEIERWEKKAKDGLLRNDSEMRRFMDDMQKSIFGDNMKILNEMGISSHEDYNKRGQLSLDEKKFTEALQNNGDKVYEVFAGNDNSVMENMKSTINKYVGGSSSIFAKKAGLEKTASAANNFYSEQLKRQADTIKILQRKMSDKENALYKKFGELESSMNKLNSQMSYFMQM